MVNQVSQEDHRSDRPTIRPTDHPTDRPSHRPNIRPTQHPTDRPSDRPFEKSSRIIVFSSLTFFGLKPILVANRFVFRKIIAKSSGQNHRKNHRTLFQIFPTSVFQNRFFPKVSFSKPIFFPNRFFKTVFPPISVFQNRFFPQVALKVCESKTQAMFAIACELKSPSILSLTARALHHHHQPSKNSAAIAHLKPLHRRAWVQDACG